MGKTITIQRTSRPLKGLLLLANLVQLFGFIMILGSQPGMGMSFIGIGIAVHVITRCLIWWFHD